MTTLINDNQSSTLVTSGYSLCIQELGIQELGIQELDTEQTDTQQAGTDQPNVGQRMVTLPAGKCTVGSSERCQVHLGNAGVRPLHCLIVMEGSGISVTRWAPGALLNGVDFATAPFRVGDCLQIGDVQLTLVAQESTPEGSESFASPNSFDSPSIAGRENTGVRGTFVTFGASSFAPPLEQPVIKDEPTQTEAFLSALRAETTLPTRVVETLPRDPETSSTESSPVNTVADEQQINRLKTANHDARNRSRGLVTALRTMRTEAASFEEKVDNLQQELTSALEVREQIHTQLSLLQNETNAQSGESSTEIDRLITELNAAHESASATETVLVEYTEQAEQLQLKLDELEKQREEWEQIRTAGDLQRSKLAQTLADRELSVESLQAELEKARNAANSADESRIEQALALGTAQAELKELLQEQAQEQLTENQAESLRNLQAAEQALAASEQDLAVLKLEVEKLQLTGGQFEEDLIERNTSYEYLEAEYLQLVAERDQLVSKRTAQQLSEQGHEHDLANHKGQIDSLTQEIEELRVTLTQANLTATDQTAVAANIQQELNAVTSERDQLLSAQADQAGRYQEWEETVAVRDRRIKELADEHDGICQVLQSVEEGAFEQVDFCRNLEAQLATLREERDELASALPKQEAYIQQLTQALADRDEQITLLHEELTKTTQRQSELETDLTEGTDAYQNLEAELNELSARCQQFLELQSTNDQSKAVAEESLSEKQTQIDALQQQLESTDQRHQELEQAVALGAQSESKSQDELESLKSLHAELSTEHQKNTEDRSELNQKLADREQDVELFMVDLQSMRGELQRTVDQTENLQSEREALAGQLVELREELTAKETAEAAAGTELSQQRDELAGELTTLRQELESTQSQIAVADEAATSLQVTIANLEAERSQLQQHAEEQTQQSEQATNELSQQRDELVRQLSTAQHELETTQSQTAQAGEASDDLQSLVTTLQADKSQLQQSVEQQVQQTETMAAELQATQSQLSAGQDVLSELTKRYEQSQHDLKQANEGLKLAEQPLLQSAATPAAVEVPVIEEAATEEVIESVPSDDTNSDTSNDTNNELVLEMTVEAEEATETNDESEQYSWGQEQGETAEPDSNAIASELADEESRIAADSFSSNSDLTSETIATETAAVEQEAVTDSAAAPTGSTAFDAPTVETEETKAEFKPASFIDQYQDLAEDDDSFVSEPVAVLPDPESVSLESPLGAELNTQDSNSEAAAEEADLEVYMSNMLRRMRGESSDDATPAPLASEELKQAADPVAAVGDVLGRIGVETPTVEETAEPGNSEPLKLEDLKRTTSKPAAKVNLSAMRELANSSARKAIAKHHKRRHLSNALGMFFACLIATGAGGYLLSVGMKAQEFLGPKFLGGSVLVFGGLIGGLKLLSLLLMAIREGSGEKKAPKEKVEQEVGEE